MKGCMFVRAACLVNTVLRHHPCTPDVTTKKKKKKASGNRKKTKNAAADTDKRAVETDDTMKCEKSVDTKRETCHHAVEMQTKEENLLGGGWV